MEATRTRGLLQADRTEEHYRPCLRMNGVIVAFIPQQASDEDVDHLVACWNAIERHCGGDPDAIDILLRAARAAHWLIDQGASLGGMPEELLEGAADARVLLASLKEGDSK